MPRYYFDTSLSGRDLIDMDGLLFKSFDAARQEAMCKLLAIAADELPRQKGEVAWIRIRNQQRREIYYGSLILDERNIAGMPAVRVD